MPDADFDFNGDVAECSVGSFTFRRHLRDQPGDCFLDTGEDPAGLFSGGSAKSLLVWPASGSKAAGNHRQEHSRRFVSRAGNCDVDTGRAWPGPFDNSVGDHVAGLSRQEDFGTEVVK